MTVTVWHLTPDRVLYRIFEGVERTEYDDRGAGTLSLYTRYNSETDPGQLIASFGPGYCWAIDTEGGKG